MNKSGEVMHPDGNMYRTKSAEEQTAELASEMVRRTDRLNDNTISLATRAMESREMLEWHVTHCKKTWMDWQEVSSGIYAVIETNRRAMETEARRLNGALNDMRAFLRDGGVQEDLRSLERYVDLCLQLKAFAKDGTLEAVNEALLKISCAHSKT